jgi:hypothetical protein
MLRTDPLNNYKAETLNGCLVETWESQCGICKFITGLARVQAPNGHGVLFSGAGCFTRRGPESVRAQVLQWIGSAMPEPVGNPVKSVDN